MLEIIHRGLEAYEDSLASMQAYTMARTRASEDQLWVVEHPPVCTLGRSTSMDLIIRPEKFRQHNIPIIRTDRGGAVTYHGPGQIIVYILLDIRRWLAQRGKTRFLLKNLVYRLEAACIATLALYGLTGMRKPGAPGVYVPYLEAQPTWDCAKIAALGLKVHKNGSTYHGLALNAALNLAPFSWIHPCGMADLPSIDMHSLGVHASKTDIQSHLLTQLVQKLED